MSELIGVRRRYVFAAIALQDEYRIAVGLNTALCYVGGIPAPHTQAQLDAYRANISNPWLDSETMFILQAIVETYDIKRDG